MKTAAIGGISRDTLAYHGTLPLSEWGGCWKRLFTDLPDDAAYGLYEQCAKACETVPMPPLQFFSSWEERSFRIVKEEGEYVIALYRDHQRFHLLRAKGATYRAWAEKSGRDPFAPKYVIHHSEVLHGKRHS